MAHHKFDTVIIGGGNAGFGASSVLAEAGKSIAFVEQEDFGGTCPNRGCTPKKILVAAAQAMDQISKAEVHGISVGAPKLDWAKLIERKDDMIGFIPDAMAGLAEKRGTVFRGVAQFTGTNTISVGEDTLEGDNIVIATGSIHRPLNISGAEHMITSDEVLSEPEQPNEVVFIGGGVVALEFSHVYARVGTKVTILEMMPELLPRMEPAAVQQLRAETERLGVTVHTGVSVDGVKQAGKALQVSFDKDGKKQSVTADRVVNGAGRIANVTGLALDVAGVEVDAGRVVINDHLQSVSNPSVWVAGDAIVGAPQLSPTATYEGQIVGRNIRDGATEKPDYSVLPSAVYTVPSLATVGMTEEQAKSKYANVKTSINDMSGWFSGKSYAESVAWCMVLVDDDTDQIVGAHMIGHNADDLIHVFSLAMKHKISATDIKNSSFAYPSFSSDIKNLI
ncbi:dihydrolipoyl dehydrogenase family protein [Kordiimonas aquimaris]|uniref:dihydrolipoyl dehydrogenase family protein n=1 Tax=Kordiimonas aquimaris TaxID=707591 RepID=UPI0021D031DD|nr:NAD(P)/FAD-dependent oxidoreductase [Kordiimonas aquimaris]